MPYDTVEQLQKTFNKILDAIVSGDLTACPTDTGLDDQMMDLLDLLAAQPVRSERSISWPAASSLAVSSTARTRGKPTRLTAHTSLGGSSMPVQRGQPQEPFVPPPP